MASLMVPLFRRFLSVRPLPAGDGSRLHNCLRLASAARANMAVQDYLVLAFHGYMWLRVSFAPDGHKATVAASATLLLLMASLCAVLLTRGAIVPAGRVRALLYRVGLFCPMAASYFTLRWLLPALKPRLLDAALLRVDEWLFVVTPARWLDPLVSHATVEWFAFFYYAYFFLLATHLLGSLLLDRGRRMHEMMFGALTVAAVGHVTYTLVPGVGPYSTCAFGHPLDVGGFWWHQVTDAVTAAGAQLDIFPSLHAAFPTLFALHSYRHRREVPYRYTWLPMGFVAVNIVVATVFLRWHYGIDVIVGLLLAALAQRLAIASYRRERRKRDGDPQRQAVWEPL